MKLTVEDINKFLAENKKNVTITVTYDERKNDFTFHGVFEHPTKGDLSADVPVGMGVLAIDSNSVVLDIIKGFELDYTRKV